MKIHFLGTCSGTEPMPNMHHCSLVMEIGDKYYWFDAGESSSHTAYTSGIDISRVRAIFISHMHIDHCGGLPNLMFTIDKLKTVTKRDHINNNSYDLYLPHIDAFPAIRDMALSFCFKSKASTAVKALVHQVSDGLIFEDDAVRISAVHNTHLGEDGNNGWHSYSYLIECEGKRIVFSGDVGKPSEVDPLVGDGCDALIMETGHHSVTSVLDYAESKNVKRLYFNHHGREILRDRDAAWALLDARDINAKICHDGMVEDI